MSHAFTLVVKSSELRITRLGCSVKLVDIERDLLPFQCLRFVRLTFLRIPDAAILFNNASASPFKLDRKRL